MTLNSKVTTLTADIAALGQYVAPEKCGAVGDNSTDDRAAIATCDAQASAAGLSLLFTQHYKIGGALTVASPAVFYPGSFVAPVSATTTILNGPVSADDQSWIFQGAGAVTTPNTGRVSVDWWGAGAPGADAAVGMRQALGSDRIIVTPPGSYTIKTVLAAKSGGGTLVTNASLTDPACSATPCHSVPYAYQTGTGVYIANLHNFTFDMTGAIFTMANGVTFSSALMFDGDTKFTVLGGTFVGNKAGLSITNENGAIVVMSAVDFSFQNQTCSGNWGGVGACFLGDWWVSGSISNLYAPQVGICTDLAFLNGVTIENSHCVGADYLGNSSNPGYGGFSIIFDPPAAGDNHTGVTFSDTNGVTISNSSASNVGWGAIIATGSNYHLSGNVFANNPGYSPNFGVGVIVINSAVGHPISGVTLSGNKLDNNGTSGTHGFGVYLETGADTISEVTVVGNIFNNNVVAAIDTNGPGVLNNIVIQDNVCLGSSQSICVSNALARSIVVPFDSEYRSVSAAAGTNAYLGNLEVGRNWENLTAALKVTLGNGYLGGSAVISSAQEPEFIWNAGSQALDSKLWFMDVVGTTLRGIVENDALSAFDTWLNVTRTGAVISDVTLRSQSTMHLQGLPTTPGGKQPLCIDTSTHQIYQGNAGVC